MAKSISYVSILLMVLASAFSQATSCNLEEEMTYTSAINARLCEPDAHPDEVARRFFACYNETITPGGRIFVGCQLMVYEKFLNSKDNIDEVCSAPPSQFQRYAGCIMSNLADFGYTPCDTMNKLNNCGSGRPRWNQLNGHGLTITVTDCTPKL